MDDLPGAQGFSHLGKPRITAKTCNRYAGPVCLFHALILKSVKKICMQKLQEVAVTAKGDISLSPRAGNETFVYMSTSCFGEAKHEIDTVDQRLYLQVLV